MLEFRALAVALMPVGDAMMSSMIGERSDNSAMAFDKYGEEGTKRSTVSLFQVHGDVRSTFRALSSRLKGSACPLCQRDVYDMRLASGSCEYLLNVAKGSRN